MTGQCETSTPGRTGINREIRYETTWDTTSVLEPGKLEKGTQRPETEALLIPIERNIQKAREAFRESVQEEGTEGDPRQTRERPEAIQIGEALEECIKGEGNARATAVKAVARHLYGEAPIRETLTETAQSAAKRGKANRAVQTLEKLARKNTIQILEALEQSAANEGAHGGVIGRD